MSVAAPIAMSSMPISFWVGAVIAKAGTGKLIGAGLMKTVAFIFVSPLMGFLLGSLMRVLVSWISRRSSPRKVDRWFRRLQLVSAGAYSLGHGGNTITGAIVGVGSVRHASAVRWGVAGNIVWAWIFTIPASALMAAVAYWISFTLF